MWDWRTAERIGYTNFKPKTKMKLILQSFGIGDVVFSMTAIRSLNDKILWGVLPEYVSALNAAYPDIFFVDWNILKIDYNKKDRYFIEDLEVIPLRWQDTPLQFCMRQKYSYFGLNYINWKSNAKFIRNYTREHELIKLLNIEVGEQFNLVNMKFGCHVGGTNFKPEAQSTNFEVNNGLRNIEMGMIDGYSLFDWSSIIERATNIFTVSTSSFYLFELLRLSAKEIHLYPRLPYEKDFRNIDYLFTKNYILHA